MKNTRPHIALSLCSLLLMLPVSATSATPDEATITPWYEVSLVIFKHRNSPTGNERWPTPDTLNISFPHGILELEPALEPATTGDGKTGPVEQAAIPFRNSKPTDVGFQQALRSIQLSSNYEIMTSASWKQPALDKEQAIPVLIQAGDEFGGYFELEGSVTLTVSRYLHMKADLWLSEYIQQVEMIAPWWESTNTVADSFGGDFDPSEPSAAPAYQDIDFGSQPSYSETVTHYESVRTVVLNESRRMRSGELHYLDNPMFGLLVKVVPYEPSTTPASDAPESMMDATPISLR